MKALYFHEDGKTGLIVPYSFSAVLENGDLAVTYNVDVLEETVLKLRRNRQEIREKIRDGEIYLIELKEKGVVFRTIADFSQKKDEDGIAKIVTQIFREVKSRIDEIERDEF